MVVPIRRRLRTLLVGVLAAAACTTVLAAPAAAAPPPTLDRVDAAAGWLARQMVDGERFEVVFDGTAYPDQGLTVDAILAFAAAKSADQAAARATAWLARPDVLAGYIGDGTEAYAGATAKLALGVQVRGLDPTAFGGVDLLDRLRGLLTPSGRFADRSAWGDYSNAFSQSFALIALARAGGAPAPAVSFLVGERCADGGFPLLFAQATCESDVDATALVVQALTAAGRADDARPAVAWLLARQAADGSFSALGVANANSTGLAAQALRVAGRPLAYLKARHFVLGLQARCAAPTADRGGIAYSAAGFDGTAVRATAQALPGLAGADFATLTATGAAPADKVLACLGGAA